MEKKKTSMIFIDAFPNLFSQASIHHLNLERPLHMFNAPTHLDLARLAPRQISLPHPPKSVPHVRLSHVPFGRRRESAWSVELAATVDPFSLSPSTTATGGTLKERQDCFVCCYFLLLFSCSGLKKKWVLIRPDL